VNTNIKGGAARSAYRIHNALLESGVDSSFLTISVKWPRDMLNVYTAVAMPFQQNRPNFFDRQINRCKFILTKTFGIYKKPLIESIKETYLRVKEQLKCEIASLPFAEFEILQNPIVQEADIIHLHWVAGILDYTTFFRENTKPVVWTFHDMNPMLGIFHYDGDSERNKHLSYILDKKVTSLKRRLIRKRKGSLAVVCPSKWMGECVKKSKIYEKVKHSHIPYPLDTKVFSPVTNNKFEELMLIPPENTVFLFVSERIDNRRKGFDLLLETLRLMTDQMVTLLVIGSTEQLEIPWADVRLLGPVSDDNLLNRYYSLADAFIIPSREDNLPNVLLEAMACGTPVISFNVGGMSEIIVDGFNGLKASSIDSNALLKAIDCFIKTKTLYKSEDIRNFALNNFSNKIIAGKYIDLYGSILGEQY